MQQGRVIHMSRSEIFRFQILSRFIEGGMTRNESAKALGKSARTISRQASRLRREGVIGVKHGNLGQCSKRRLPEELKAKVLKLVRLHYFDFNIQHLKDILAAKHAVNLSYTTLWRWCSEAKLIKSPRKGRRTVRRIRPRMAQEGYFLQMDGCEHKFNGQDTWCLIGAIDDATSDIPYAEFFQSESTLACMQVLKRIIEFKGIPSIIYTDQAGWAGKIKREQFTQFKRACEDLGIALIFANSPEAKGRIERAWRTMQDRLCPELRINNIRSMSEANRYLQTQFLPRYWRQSCVVKASSDQPAYRALEPRVTLENILCIEHVRKIAKDQSISWHGVKFEIVSKHTFNLRNYEAVVRHYIDGSTKVFVMGHEVGVRATERPGYSNPFADREANVCLIANYQSVHPAAYEAKKDDWITRVYGSKETYEKLCRNKPA
jgi:transposase